MIILFYLIFLVSVSVINIFEALFMAGRPVLSLSSNCHGSASGVSQGMVAVFYVDEFLASKVHFLLRYYCYSFFFLLVQAQKGALLLYVQPLYGQLV